MNKLVVVTNSNIISDLRANNIRLLYPLKSFCVGYNTYFDINDIDDFVLVNRILDNDDIQKLDKIIHVSNIKGIVFDDLGILDDNNIDTSLLYPGQIIVHNFMNTVTYRFSGFAFNFIIRNSS